MQHHNLSRSQWSLLCNRVLDELGLGDHQALVGLHHDVKYPGSDKTRTHAHLLINLVNDAGKCFESSCLHIIKLCPYMETPYPVLHCDRSADKGLMIVGAVGLEPTRPVKVNGFSSSRSFRYSIR